jgi:hypothetical protein
MAGKMRGGHVHFHMHWSDNKTRKPKVTEETDNPAVEIGMGDDSQQDWTFLWKDADVDENGTFAVES